MRVARDEAVRVCGGLVERIKTDLAALLRRDGFDRVADAVGADAAGKAEAG